MILDAGDIDLEVICVDMTVVDPSSIDTWETDCDFLSRNGYCEIAHGETMMQVTGSKKRYGIYIKERAIGKIVV